jgi:hypothetical protein
MLVPLSEFQNRESAVVLVIVEFLKNLYKLEHNMARVNRRTLFADYPHGSGKTLFGKHLLHAAVRYTSKIEARNKEVSVDNGGQDFESFCNQVNRHPGFVTSFARLVQALLLRHTTTPTAATTTTTTTHLKLLLPMDVDQPSPTTQPVDWKAEALRLREELNTLKRDQTVLHYITRQPRLHDALIAAAKDANFDVVLRLAKWMSIRETTEKACGSSNTFEYALYIAKTTSKPYHYIWDTEDLIQKIRFFIENKPDVGSFVKNQ